MEALGFNSELAYELIPTTDEQILQIDTELQDLYI